MCVWQTLISIYIYIYIQIAKNMILTQTTWYHYSRLQHFKHNTCWCCFVSTYHSKQTQTQISLKSPNDHVCTARLPFGNTKTHVKLRQKKTISHNIYGEIIFQKVTSAYLLHFVQDGSSTNVLEKILFGQTYKQSNILDKMPYISPPLTPDQPPFKGGRYVNPFFQ